MRARMERDQAHDPLVHSNPAKVASPVHGMKPNHRQLRRITDVVKQRRRLKNLGILTEKRPDLLGPASDPLNVPPPDRKNIGQVTLGKSTRLGNVDHDRLSADENR